MSEVNYYNISANNIPLLALQWPSMRCHCVCAKLAFLYTGCDLIMMIFYNLTIFAASDAI